MKIIGITGTLGAGKGEVVEYLKTLGFSHFPARDFIIREVERRGLTVNRDNTTMVANDLRSKYSPSYIIETLYNLAKDLGKNAIIESVRALAELEFLRTQENFILISVDAPPEIRYQRIQKRKSDLDRVSFEKFMSDEEREMHSDDPTKGNIAGCMKDADYTIYNDGTVEELHKKLDEILSKIMPK